VAQGGGLEGGAGNSWSKTSDAAGQAPSGMEVKTSDKGLIPVGNAALGRDQKISEIVRKGARASTGQTRSSLA